MRTFLIAISLTLAAGAAVAQMTPVGLWKTIDDDGKTEKSLVRISEAAGVVSGRIDKSFDAASKPSDTCDKCTDDRKGKPIVGLQILRGLKQGIEDRTIWEGGDVLDPENGKTYRVRLKPLNGGKELQLRGYLGPFYRTQTWIRVE